MLLNPFTNVDMTEPLLRLRETKFNDIFKIVNDIIRKSDGEIIIGGDYGLSKFLKIERKLDSYFYVLYCYKVKEKAKVFVDELVKSGEIASYSSSIIGKQYNVFSTPFKILELYEINIYSSINIFTVILPYKTKDGLYLFNFFQQAIYLLRNLNNLELYAKFSVYEELKNKLILHLHTDTEGKHHKPYINTHTQKINDKLEKIFDEIRYVKVINDRLSYISNDCPDVILTKLKRLLPQYEFKWKFQLLFNLEDKRLRKITFYYLNRENGRDVPIMDIYDISKFIIIMYHVKNDKRYAHPNLNIWLLFSNIWVLYVLRKMNIINDQTLATQKNIRISLIMKLNEESDNSKETLNFNTTGTYFPLILYDKISLLKLNQTREYYHG